MKKINKMKFKEYLAELNKIAKKNPETLNMDVIYSKDDEGNGYQQVSYEPSKGFYDGDEFTGEGHFEECEITENPNAICIN